MTRSKVTRPPGRDLQVIKIENGRLLALVNAHFVFVELNAQNANEFALHRIRVDVPAHYFLNILDDP